MWNFQDSATQSSSGYLPKHTLLIPFAEFYFPIMVTDISTASEAVEQLSQNISTEGK